MEQLSVLFCYIGKCTDAAVRKLCSVITGLVTMQFQNNFLLLPQLVVYDPLTALRTIFGLSFSRLLWRSPIPQEWDQSVGQFDVPLST